ncbi:SH3 domain-containing protein [Streptomyces flavofungini]|uniref:SH3 domain-containing protein n=1 Tax=Streptomyces flavofungini TaxID=68200 RepID=UPI0034DF27F9
MALAKSGKPVVHSGRAAVKGQAAPGAHRVSVTGAGCGRWVGTARLTVAADKPVPKTVKGTVISKTGLKVRQRPTSNSKVTGVYRTGRSIDLLCKRAGQDVGGNRTWYRVTAPQGWVTARYVKVHGTVPVCR